MRKAAIKPSYNSKPNTNKKNIDTNAQLIKNMEVTACLQNYEAGFTTKSETRKLLKNILREKLFEYFYCPEENTDNMDKEKIIDSMLALIIMAENTKNYNEYISCFIMAICGFNRKFVTGTIYEFTNMNGFDFDKLNFDKNSLNRLDLDRDVDLDDEIDDSNSNNNNNNKNYNDYNDDFNNEDTNKKIKTIFKLLHQKKILANWLPPTISPIRIIIEIKNATPQKIGFRSYGRMRGVKEIKPLREDFYNIFADTINVEPVDYNNNNDNDYDYYENDYYRKAKAVDSDEIILGNDTSLSSKPKIYFKNARVLYITGKHNQALFCDCMYDPKIIKIIISNDYFDNLYSFLIKNNFSLHQTLINYLVINKCILPSATHCYGKLQVARLMSQASVKITNATRNISKFVQVEDIVTDLNIILGYCDFDNIKYLHQYLSKMKLDFLIKLWNHNYKILDVLIDTCKNKDYIDNASEILHNSIRTINLRNDSRAGDDTHDVMYFILCYEVLKANDELNMITLIRSQIKKYIRCRKFMEIVTLLAPTRLSDLVKLLSMDHNKDNNTNNSLDIEKQVDTMTYKIYPFIELYLQHYEMDIKTLGKIYKTLDLNIITQTINRTKFYPTTQVLTNFTKYLSNGYGSNCNVTMIILESIINYKIIPSPEVIDIILENIVGTDYDDSYRSDINDNKHNLFMSNVLVFYLKNGLTVDSENIHKILKVPGIPIDILKTYNIQPNENTYYELYKNRTLFNYISLFNGPIYKLRQLCMETIKGKTRKGVTMKARTAASICKEFLAVIKTNKICPDRYCYEFAIVFGNKDIMRIFDNKDCEPTVASINSIGNRALTIDKKKYVDKIVKVLQTQEYMAKPYEQLRSLYE